MIRFHLDESFKNLLRYVYHVYSNGSTSTEEMRWIHVSYAEMNTCESRGERLGAEREKKLLCATAGILVGNGILLYRSL